jgi:hypothetical protein
MDHMPGVASVSFYQKKWSIEAVAIVPPILIAGVAVWINYNDPAKKPAALVYLIATLWLLIASVLRIKYAYDQDVKEAKQKSHEGLRGAVHVLYSNVSRHLKYEDGDPGRLRVTMHRVVFEGEKKDEPTSLEQMIPYIGGKGGGEGRSFSINPGIIGQVARSGEVRAASRADDDHAAFIAELVSKWFYKESEARSLTSDRKAWMAVPILSTNRTVLVVVYLDSSDRNAFDEATLELVINGCTGIATYISQYYSLPVVSGTSSKPSPKAQIEKVVEVSAQGASLKETHVVLTGEAELELTSTAASLSAAGGLPKVL